MSAAAGVGAGTLFRYAATGSELMLMVYNEALRSSMAEGAARAAEKSAAYQRELLFGPHDAKFRAEGMELIFALEASLSDTLRRAAPHLSDDETQAAASSLFAVAHLAIARMTVSEIPPAAAIDDLRRQVTQIVTGVLHHTPATERRPRHSQPD